MEARSQIEGNNGPASWPRALRFAFRFAFVYLILYNLPFPLEWHTHTGLLPAFSEDTKWRPSPQEVTHGHLPIYRS